MISLIFILVANALALLGTAYLVPGIHIDTFMTALLAALVLGLLNTFVKPFLLFLTLPVNILTLGLFSWVVSAAVLWLGSYFVRGFTVDNFLSALVGGILLAFISSLLHSLVRR